MKKSIITIFVAFALLAFVQAQVNKTESTSCYAGRAGCIASCKVQGCATGTCVGPASDPSKQTCVCSRCHEEDKKILNEMVCNYGQEACESNCKIQQSLHGECLNQESEIVTTCQCSNSLENDIATVNSVSCYAGRTGCIASCKVQGCATGTCLGPASDPSKQTCVCSRCHEVEAQHINSLSCRAGRTGCIASCKLQNCQTGYCDGPPNDPARQVCRCSRCYNPFEIEKNQLSCQVGGRVGCIASCKLQDCRTGYCGGPDGNTCICSGCT